MDKPLTQEWTPELVKEMVEVGGGYNAVAITHNAALAAEQEKREQIATDFKSEYNRVCEQLASERENVRVLVRALKEIRDLVTLRRIHQIVDAAAAKVKEAAK